MLKYILKRLAIFVPTLFAISLLAFAISVNSPGDPVEIFYSGAKGGNGEGQNAQNESTIEAKKELRHKLGLDLPVFYFTISSCASPDTLYKITDPEARETLDRLIARYGNWNEISVWYRCLTVMKDRAKKIIPDSSAYALLGKEKADKDLDDTRQEINALFLSDEEVVINSKFEKIGHLIANESSLGPNSGLNTLDDQLTECRNAFAAMKDNSSTWKTWIPAIHFYGHNQYQRWLLGDGNPWTGAGAVNTKGVIRGDFGLSYFEKVPVSEIISQKLPWSLFFTLLSVLLAYLVSIPIGVRAAANRG
ncbi:MAG TPA: hypothetical protein VL651_02040, partial [Bacteroidia bacterium]|nr:hypothetical protein [Bacteroidia bacterium]